MPHLEFWQSRWRGRNTPWDMGRAHPGMDILAADLTPGRAYVPACGRAHEGIWLARRGWQVVAEDLVPEAIAEAKNGAGETSVEFRVGDLFRVAETDRGAFDLIVDRAAFCAMPPALWPRYLDAMADRLPEGGRLISFPFVESVVPAPEGPPFFIEPLAWKRLAETRFIIERCEDRLVDRPGTSLRRELLALARKR